MADEFEMIGSQPLWDVKDVARFLGASASWVYKAAERNTIPTVRIGTMLRFEPKAIRDFVATLANRGAR